MFVLTITIWGYQTKSFSDQRAAYRQCSSNGHLFHHRECRLIDNPLSWSLGCHANDFLQQELDFIADIAIVVVRTSHPFIQLYQLLTDSSDISLLF